MTSQTLLFLAALLTFAVGLAHSYLGEKYILMRLLRRDDLPKLFGDQTFTARTLRFAWHLTTLAWWGFGVMLWLASRGQLSAENALAVLAVTMLVTAATILIASRGRHLAWPVFAAIGVIAMLATAGCAAARPGESEPATAPVLFICEHGSVKSLMAASLFDRAAKRRGLEIRALSRGVNPDDAVPPAIATAMQREGFDVTQFRPQQLTASDFTHTAAVVAIGIDLSGQAIAGDASIESWNDVPAASLDYDAARADLARRIEALLDRLQAMAGNSP